MGRRQQPLDQAVERVGSRIADEFVDLLRRRRQAHEVERRAADQRRSIGRRRERQAALGELLSRNASIGVCTRVVDSRLAALAGGPASGRPSAIGRLS